LEKREELEKTKNARREINHLKKGQGKVPNEHKKRKGQLGTGTKNATPDR